jgi:molybdenum cofactor sulfurtransferase
VLSYKTFEREAADAGFHVRTGAECNPGAAYSYLGVQECEVASLAGVKEGCGDDVEFITVERNCTPSGGGGGLFGSVGGGAGGGAAASAAAAEAAAAAAAAAMDGSGGVSSSMDGGAGAAASSIALGHPAEVASQYVEVPLGSVRVSLGFMSVFEDCHALIEFMRARYTDRTQ